MKIYFNCHKDIHQNPRGGEISVRIIIDYLSEFFDVDYGEYHSPIPKADIYLTWGNAAQSTYEHCVNKHPYILMVRFWRNVCPLPAGDIINRELPTYFKDVKQPIFGNAAAVITNTDYACKVIKKHYNVEALTSYVPITGEPLKSKGKYLTIINPEIYGEFELAEGLKDHKLLIADCNDPRFTRLDNCTVWGRSIADYIYANTKILLLPTYHNDICGTRRISIEAMRYGIPVIANFRCGIDEWVPNLVTRDAYVSEWEEEIDEITNNYDQYSKEAHEVFSRYDTEKQLKIFKDEIENAVN